MIALALLSLTFLSRAVAAPTTSFITLNAAYSAAAARNESLQQSSEQVVQSEALLTRARGAILPQVSLDASHLIQPEPDDPIAREFSPGQQTTVWLTAAQPLFRGFREFSALRRQGYLADAQRARSRQAALALYEETATKYLNVLALEQDLRNLEEQAEIYGKRASELKGRAGRGESSTSELLSAQASQASVLAELRLAQGQLKVAREAFASLTGLAPEAELSDPALLKRELKGALKPLDAYLSRVDERPGIRASLAELEAADSSVSIARGGHLPTLDAVGHYYLKRPGFLSETKWDLELRASLPLFQGFSTVAQTRESVSLRKQSELELARSRRAASDEIRALHEGLKARVDHVELLSKSVELSERNSQVSRRDYGRGLVRNIDVQLAMTDYRVARRALDQARFAARLDLIKLEIASNLAPGDLP